MLYDVVYESREQQKMQLAQGLYLLGPTPRAYSLNVQTVYEQLAGRSPAHEGSYARYEPFGDITKLTY